MWKDLYEQKLTTADEAVKLIKSNQIKELFLGMHAANLRL
jgi:acyl-CoA hydrolase